MVTDAKSWKKKEEKKGYELPLPSGNVCLVTRPGPEVFLKQGGVPNGLLGIVLPLLEEAQEKGKQGDGAPLPDEAMVELQKAITADPAKLADMFEMVDNITVQCVLEPLVSPAPPKGTARDPELLYVDEVDFEDKIFIFQFAVGGTADLEQFRSGTQALVAAGQDS